MKLELRNLTCGYQKQKPVIKHIDFEVDSGEICALLGPNGVGKTTLFKTILNMLSPLEGQVCVDGENIRKWSPKKLSQYMAYVAQAHVPHFPYLVKDIVMLGRIGQTSVIGKPSVRDYEITEQALEEVGIRHLRDEVYTDISGGERQLLMIAKALAQNPKILIMDEPTANLDYGNMVMVLKCICGLAKKGLAVIFTTHMPDQAFMCNAKTAILFRNETLAFGDASQVITESNLYKAYQTEIQILNVIDKSGNPIRICTPQMAPKNEIGNM